MAAPLQYKYRLGKLEVPLDSYLFGLPPHAKISNPSVRIHKYQNTKLSGDNGPAPTQSGMLYGLCNADTSPDKPKTMGGLSIPTTEIDLLIGAVHQGVGSANQIVTVLQLVAHYGWKKQFPYIEPFSAGDAGTRLQQYCDRYIGLDCVGFVLGFARDVRHASIGYAGNYGTATFKGYAVSPVATGARMVWDDGDISHIALIDDILAPALDGTMRVRIIESIGEGSPKIGLHEDCGTLRPDSPKGYFIFTREDVPKIARQNNRVKIV
jgi:hypothetical protein